MPRLRFRGPDDGPGPEPGAFPFPRTQPGSDSGREHQTAPDGSSGAPGRGSLSDALDALESVSRRMEDLARALGCLGYFDDDDRPRAA
ncbi:MAG: hypothetical protein ACYTES_08830 [Planctomycetota bacterium]|jgi:hypothetical protein